MHVPFVYQSASDPSAALVTALRPAMVRERTQTGSFGKTILSYSRVISSNAAMFERARK